MHKTAPEVAMICDRVLPLLLIATCVSQPALAQINPFFGTRATPLDADDITAVRQATDRLLDRPRLAPGGQEAWTNTESGASGTVTAGNPVQREGLICRVVRYDTNVPGPRPHRSTTLTWCKTQYGWKIG